jgi:hypothetical protein
MRPQDLNAAPRHVSRFMVGRDRTGHWVVADTLGLVGGVFADRASAVHFALEESDHNPGEVCAAPDGVVLSLDAVFGRH